ncbi:MAG: hypothetical protein Q9196_000757 [Gyalolechia fulgens]
MFAGKISQRLAEYDLWAEEHAKEEVEKMARERDVSFTTVKKDIRNSGQMVAAILNYLGHPKPWTIVILLLAYIPKQKLDEMNTKILSDLVPQPKIYHGNRIYQSRDVFEILKTAYYPFPAQKLRIHRRRRVINAPEGGSIHQLILPLLTQCQPHHKFRGRSDQPQMDETAKVGYAMEDIMDAALSDLQCFAKEPNPDGRGYIQEAEIRLRDLVRENNHLLSVSPVVQQLRSFIQTSKDQFDDENRHLASQEILDYIKTLESINGSVDGQWLTAQKRGRDKYRIGISEEQQIGGTRQPQDGDVAIIGSSVDIAAILDKLDWSMHYP